MHCGLFHHCNAGCISFQNEKICTVRPEFCKMKDRELAIKYFDNMKCISFILAWSESRSLQRYSDQGHAPCDWPSHWQWHDHRHRRTPQQTWMAAQTQAQMQTQTETHRPRYRHTHTQTHRHRHRHRSMRLVSVSCAQTQRRPYLNNFRAPEARDRCIRILSWQTHRFNYTAKSLTILCLHHRKQSICWRYNLVTKYCFLGKGSKSDNALFIFDEPTTGLHFHDIKKLLKSFQALISKGHSVIVIEHNIDLIICADYIIDLGPEGGKHGGQLVASGTPEEIVKNKNSVTGKYLQEKL